MRSNRVIIGLILLTTVALLNLPLPASMRVKAGVRDNMANYQNVWLFVVRSWSRTFSAFAGARRHVEERRAMLQEIANLEFRIRSLEKLKEENEELRRQVEFRKKNKYEMVLCEVISRDGTGGWWHTIILNKGADEGIRPNNAVITRRGLVGTTIRVTKSTSEVLLLCDANCKVACKLERTGSLGILRGAGVTLGGSPDLEMLSTANPPVMQYIRKDQRLVEGDKVVTSGLGGVYPEGLLVGHMKQINLDRSELYYSAEIEPAEDMMALNYVFVIKREPK